MGLLITVIASLFIATSAFAGATSPPDPTLKWVKDVVNDTGSCNQVQSNQTCYFSNKSGSDLDSATAIIFMASPLGGDICVVDVSSSTVPLTTNVWARRWVAPANYTTTNSIFGTILLASSNTILKGENCYPIETGSYFVQFDIDVNTVISITGR